MMTKWPDWTRFVVVFYAVLLMVVRADDHTDTLRNMIEHGNTASAADSPADTTINLSVTWNREVKRKEHDSNSETIKPFRRQLTARRSLARADELDAYDIYGNRLDQDVFNENIHRFFAPKDDSSTSAAGSDGTTTLASATTTREPQTQLPDVHVPMGDYVYLEDFGFTDSGSDEKRPDDDYFYGDNKAEDAQCHRSCDCSAEKGQQGEVGLPGPPGPRGHQGLPGLDGLQGSKGGKGARGINGTQGPKGEQGLSGHDGLPGHRGHQGIPGVQGEPGFPGFVGSPGIAGQKGVKGQPGPEGNEGAKGDRGLPGLPGENGLDGATGLPGIQGDRGEPGIPGCTGAKGLNGDRGERGLPGSPGVSGRVGVQGPPGSYGLPGMKGEKGDGCAECHLSTPSFNILVGQVQEYMTSKPADSSRNGEKFPIENSGETNTADKKEKDCDTAISELMKRHPGLKGDKGSLGRAGIPGYGIMGPPGLPGLPGRCSCRDGIVEGNGHHLRGSRGFHGIPGLPGQKGEPGQTETLPQTELDGSQEKLRQRVLDILESLDSKNRNTVPSTSSTTGHVYAVHSQTKHTPSCPNKHVVLWSGYSFVQTQHDDKPISAQDIGSSGSCLTVMSPVPYVFCNSKENCSQKHGPSSSIWLATNETDSLATDTEFTTTERFISRCVVCLSTQFLVTTHSQSSFVPNCPVGFSTLWEGYSFLHFTSNSAAIGQHLSSPGSCLRHFRSHLFVECSDREGCRLLKNQNNYWLGNYFNNGIFNFFRKYTDIQIKTGERFHVRNISKCKVCVHV